MENVNRIESQIKLNSAQPSAPRSDRKPKRFWVDVDTRMLRRAKLSVVAERLYLAMRALAKGQTGELKRPRSWRRSDEEWIDNKAIESYARMGRDVRQRAMKELIAFGLVTRRREYVTRWIKGRSRCVHGPSHYTVHKHPKTITATKAAKTLPFVLTPDSTVAVKAGPQVFIKPTTTVCGVAAVGVDFELKPERASERNHHQHHEIDDDAGLPVSQNLSKSKPANLETKPSVEAKSTSTPIPESKPEYDRLEKIQARAVAEVVARGKDPEFVTEAIAFIDARAEMVGSVPATPNYYVTGFDALSEQDVGEIQDRIQSERETQNRIEELIDRIPTLAEVQSFLEQRAGELRDVAKQIRNGDRRDPALAKKIRTAAASIEALNSSSAPWSATNKKLRDMEIELARTLDAAISDSDRTKMRQGVNAHVEHFIGRRRKSEAWIRNRTLHEWRDAIFNRFGVPPLALDRYF